MITKKICLSSGGPADENGKITINPFDKSGTLLKKHPGCYYRLRVTCTDSGIPGNLFPVIYIAGK